MEHGIDVAGVLALPELGAGDPELVAGRGGTAREVRWAHVVAGADALELLDGGELILTTGAGWSTDSADLEELACELVDSRPAAVVLELGEKFPSAPAPLVSACDEHGIPLVVLHRRVRFVQITQRIHQRVLAVQTEALAARAEVHAMLTELGLNRSPVDYVVERLAETLGAPVVLEDSAHRVVAWSGSDSEAVLGEWVRARGRDFSLPEGWEQVPVEAQGNRWGRVTALPGPAHPAGRRTVLELGAFALALGRLADGERDQWLELSSKQLFDLMLGGRYRRDTELATQLSAAGLPVDGRELLGATLRGVGDFGAHESLERAVLETALRRAVAPAGRVILVPDSEWGSAPGGRGGPAGPSGPVSPGGPVGLDGWGSGSRSGASGSPLLALLSFPPDDARAGASGAQGADAPPLAERLARELEMLLPDTTPSGWSAHLGLGASGRGVRSLITSLQRVRAAGGLRPAATVGRVSVQQAERQPLAYLVRGFSGAPEMQEFASAALGPLIEHDATAGPGHSGDLLRVLRAALDHPSNRSLAAQQARLSRSVFYQRLALIEDLLGVDLADGTTIATLTVALLARG